MSLNFPNGHILKYVYNLLLFFLLSYRKRLWIGPEPDNPLKAKKNTIYSETNQHIEFWMSDFRKDAGSHTVPFFDTQSVVTSPAAPLNGLEIYHRGAEGYGGFIALKLITLNTPSYWNDNNL